MPLRGSAIVVALEDFWDELRSEHSTLPHATISIATVKRALGLSYGDKVVVTFGAIKHGAETVAAALVHEAVHQALAAAGVRETRRHTATFHRAAVEFGLLDEDPPHPLGAVELSEAAEARYAAHIEAIREAIKGY